VEKPKRFHLSPKLIQGCEGQMCQGSNHRHTAEMSLLLLQTFWQPALFVVCVRARYEWMLHFWGHCSQNAQSTQTKKVRNPNTHHEGISHLTPSPGSLDFFPTPHRPCKLPTRLCFQLRDRFVFSPWRSNAWVGVEGVVTQTAPLPCNKTLLWKGLKTEMAKSAKVYSLYSCVPCQSCRKMSEPFFGVSN